MKTLAGLTTFSIVFAVVAVSLAVPTNSRNSQEVISRSRRDLTGVFDSLANGFTGFIGGIHKVGDSVKSAFFGIFSVSNKKAVEEGFDKLKTGVKGAMTDLHNHVKDGVNHVKDKVKKAFGGGQSNDKVETTEAPSTATEPSEPSEKTVTPAGAVPEEETT